MSDDHDKDIKPAGSEADGGIAKEQQGPDDSSEGTPFEPSDEDLEKDPA